MTQQTSSSNPTHILPTQETLSYSDMLSKKNTPSFPKKDQAIIIEILDKLPLESYINALSEIIEVNKITFISRISGNRICIYLQSKNDVENLLQRREFIMINNQKHKIRSFITPSHRLCLTVFPSVPHNVVINHLVSLGIKPMSEMQFLSAGLSDKKYTHIRSFKRYIFIHAEHPDIPEEIPITYDNEQYRIFINLDNTKCTHCNRFGHESNACKKQPQNTNNINTNQNFNQNRNINIELNNPQPTSQQSLIDESTQETPKLPQTPNTNQTQPQNNNQIHSETNMEIDTQPPNPKDKNKRLHSELSSSQESVTETIHSATPDTQIPTQIPNTTQKITETKKTKKQKQTIPEILEVFKKPIELEPEKYVLSFEKFKNLIVKAQGVESLDPIIKEYDTQPEHIVEMIDILYNTSYATQKSRIALTRTKNKIFKTSNEHSDPELARVSSDAESQ